MTAIPALFSRAVGAVAIGAGLGCALVVTPVDPAARQPPATREQVRRFDRVVVIVFENQDRSCAVKDSYFLGLARPQEQGAGALLDNFQGLFHDSYPNYIAMVAGTIFDFPTLHSHDSDHQVDWPEDHYTIADTLEAAGKTWRGYAEDYPAAPADSAPFLLDASGKLYRRRHVPFLSFTNITTTKNAQARWKNVVSVQSANPDNPFAEAVRRNTLPDYSFYTPNMVNDGHDETPGPRSVAGGEAPPGCEGTNLRLRHASAWLRSFLSHGGYAPLDPKTDSDQVMGFPKGTLIVVTFDESATRSHNAIYTLLFGDMVRAGIYPDAYNHYNVLRTIEDNFCLPPLARGDATAKPIERIWKTPGERCPCAPGSGS